jgi:hypothetical protein
MSQSPDFTAPGASRSISFLSSGDRSRYGYDFVPIPQIG